MAQVVRIRRSGGHLVQDCDVYIGCAVNRGGWNLPVSPWANPFNTYNSGTRAEACRRYEYYLRNLRPDLMARLPELEGKRLGCWCAPELCHGDVLVNLLEEERHHKNAANGLPAQDENVSNDITKMNLPENAANRNVLTDITNTLPDMNPYRIVQ